MFNVSQPKAVDSKIIRGGRPINKAAIQQLRQMGVTTVICLLKPERVYSCEIKDVTTEKAAVLEAGMKFVYIPLDEMTTPTTEDLKKFFVAVEDSKGKVYLHCNHGVDRTGILVAIYELEVVGKTYEDAHIGFIRGNHDFRAYPNLDMFLYDYARTIIGDHISPMKVINTAIPDSRSRKKLYERIMGLVY
jgi:protein tyrosine phosphatase (PTP) superfamily phosphohydrolase (DUF442 family)